MEQIKCPICGNNAKYEYWSGPWGTEEEIIDCPFCNYGEHFCYGAREIAVGKNLFYQSYNDTNNHKRLMNKRISKAMFMARRNWKKHKKKTIAMMMTC